MTMTMKTIFSYSFQFVMLMFVAMSVVSCSSDDNTFAEQQAAPELPVIHFTAQLGAKGNGSPNGAKMQAGAPRRVVTDPDTGILDAEWQENEELAVIYEVDGTKNMVTAKVNAVSDGIAFIEADLIGSPADGSAMKLVYPAAAADKDEASGVKADYLASTVQNGTLDGDKGISKKFDVATGDGILSVNGTTGGLKEMATLRNIYAMLKLSFKDASDNKAITGMCALVINDEVTGETLAKVRGEALSSIYVAMEPISSTTTVRFTAVSPSATYTNTASLSRLVASKFYRSTLKLNVDGPGAVDPGLTSGILWASWNVGAKASTEYGEFFAWGETTGYTSSTKGYNHTTSGGMATYTGYEDHNFNWANYSLCSGTATTLTKYNNDSSDGTVDNKATLEAEDEVAHVEWGGAWRMPTYEEFKELVDSYPRAKSTPTGKLGYNQWVTTYKNKSVGGVAFYKGGAVILFLPAAGARSGTNLANQKTGYYYWTSSRDNSYPSKAHFHRAGSGGGFYIDEVRERYLGYSVRPVLDLKLK